MNKIVSPVADYRDQTARTDCVDDTKKCRKQRLESASQCNSSAVSDLIVDEIHICQRSIGLVVVAAGCPTRKVGLSKKNTCAR